MTSVLILGGGIGGLSAAHELVDRGYDVTVVERGDALGGKARSQPVAGSGTDGRDDLPGEHGFRFYPRFYRHVIDTMERTPLVSDPARSVADNLRDTSEAALAMADDQPLQRFLRRRPDNAYSVIDSIELFFQDMDVDTADVAIFGLKVLEFMTSCSERRVGEYEDVSWWTFLGGNGYSDNFRKFLRVVPRTMVAMDPQRGSARTIGAVSMQLLLDFASTGMNNDRTMNGPTSDAWIAHWEAHLRARGVAFRTGESVAALDFDGARITGVRTDGGATHIADHYVAALPLDVLHGLLTPAIGAADPQLERLRAASLDELVSWMVGIQYFLYEDVPMVPGHIFYADAPWALTSISQAQFWRERGLFRRTWGNGEVGGVISVDVSDWFTPGTFVPREARFASAAEVADEVWRQLKAHLNEPGRPLLTDDNLHSWHLDDEIVYAAGAPSPENRAPLLVHPPGSWHLRPEAASAIPNLVLAADFVRTFTDLASMEGANEAARRAVNAILDRDGHTGARADIWPLREPDDFDHMKAIDRRLYHAGRPHLFQILRVGSLFGAANLMRRLARVTGLAALDDYLDQYKLTRLLGRVLGRG